MSKHADEAIIFDTARAIGVYLDILNQRNNSYTPDMQTMFDGIAARLRGMWHESTGADNLHESATGEPLPNWTQPL